MRIFILTENMAGGIYGAEHGLSYIVEIDDQKILFDTGHSDLFLKNAQKMEIDIDNEIETVVLSHGHWDHGNGLMFLENKKLITHPEAFIRRFRKRDYSTVGLSFSKAEIEEKYDLIETKKPYQLTEHLTFLGEIKRQNSFEGKTTSFIDDFRNDDFVVDDSALVAVVNNKLVVITGCSHSGVCNIVEYAKEVTGITEVEAVIGGFHLKKQNDELTNKTIDYFVKNKVNRIFPSHCTELPALTAFYNKFKSKQVRTGMIFEF